MRHKIRFTPTFTLEALHSAAIFALVIISSQKICQERGSWQTRAIIYRFLGSPAALANVQSRHLIELIRLG
jgi:hypothetical protein